MKANESTTTSLTEFRFDFFSLFLTLHHQHQHQHTRKFVSTFQARVMDKQQVALGSRRNILFNLRWEPEIPGDEQRAPTSRPPPEPQDEYYFGPDANHNGTATGAALAKFNRRLRVVWPFHYHLESTSLSARERKMTTNN